MQESKKQKEKPTSKRELFTEFLVSLIAGILANVIAGLILKILF